MYPWQCGRLNRRLLLRYNYFSANSYLRKEICLTGENSKALSLGTLLRLYSDIQIFICVRRIATEWYDQVLALETRGGNFTLNL